MPDRTVNLQTMQTSYLKKDQAIHKQHLWQDAILVITVHSTPHKNEDSLGVMA